MGIDAEGEVIQTVREGSLCTAQGALKQAGDVGVALA